MSHSKIVNENYIFPFSIPKFKTQVFQNSYDINIDNSFHFEYLCNYLTNIECKYFLEEINYVDKDYLDDYLHYYGACHNPPSRLCKRYHFFKEKPDILNALFTEKYTDDNLLNLKRLYQGFIVIKPIPNMMGKCCLIPYLDINSDGIFGHIINRQHILTLRKYEIHLFGIPLTIESLAFQQQDTVISMCSTAALWVIFQKTNNYFGYYIPTPYEITKKANEFTLKRPFPSSGLNFIQIINTIRSYGMDLEVSGISSIEDSNRDFLSYCYAYLRGGFPIFMGVYVETKNGDQGNHAIALLGYKLNESYFPNQQLPMVGSRIKFFYVHDDNIGPFAKFQIELLPSKIHDSPIKFSCDEYGDKLYPTGLIIPLYRKIRYPFSKIQIALEEILTLFKMVELSFLNQIPEWDCYLTTSNEYKKSILESKLPIPDKEKQKILISDFPRFIWRSTFFINQVALFDLIADATQATNMFPFMQIIFFHSEFQQIFPQIIEAMKKSKKKFPEFPQLQEFLLSQND